MTGIVDLAKVTATNETTDVERDTWILEIPAEICEREGYADGTLVSLTIRDGGIRTSIIQPSAEIDDFVNRVAEEEKEFFKQMERVGDNNDNNLY